MYKTKNIMSYFSQKTAPFIYIASVITSHPLLNGFVNLEIYFFLFVNINEMFCVIKII